MASQGQDSAVFTTLAYFDGSTNGGNASMDLAQGTDGNLYGTTPSYGPNGSGTAFKVTPTGSLTVLYSFCSQTNCTDGGIPSGLLLGTDGTFYASTTQGGANLNSASCANLFLYCGGTIFKMTASGTLTTLYNFCSQTNCTDGTLPFGGLIQGTDGDFYGVAGAGGANANSGPCAPYGCGTAFKISPSGTLTTLHSFCSESNCTDGAYPNPMIQATDGNFYGTTLYGGATGYGTVFKIAPAGTLTTIYNFCSQTNCTDGFYAGPMIQATNGNFYGLTARGGANGSGTMFQITPRGTLTTVYNFCSQINCADGNLPTALLQATDGNFYGTTLAGGGVVCDGGCGTVFEIAPGGTLTTLHSFDVTDGFGATGLAQATNGTFYGSTGLGGVIGGTFYYGTIFSLSTGLGPFLKTVPASAKVGAPVTILGTDLTGANSVRFNGKEAAFTVVSATEITATVPPDGKTGFVTVHTPSGTLKSNVKFQVLP
jgi:uncharacterized repeat protein (TIGR03803 family)